MEFKKSILNALVLSFIVFNILPIGIGVSIPSMKNTESIKFSSNLHYANLAAPTLKVDCSINPSTMFIAGTENNLPDKAQVTLTLSGVGNSSQRSPLDIIFAIDSSGSMQVTDPNDLRLAATKNFIDKLDPSIDQVGVVAWGHNVDFSENLTNDFDYVKDRVDTIDHFGGTRVWVGLDRSNYHLDIGGRPGTRKVILFLTDGEDKGGEAAALDEAQHALNQGYIIHTVGLESNFSKDLLQEIADITGGDFYTADTAVNLDPIFNYIVGYVNSPVVGTNIIISQTLASNIIYVNNSVSKTPSSFNPDTNTFIWNAGIINIGEYWQVTFEIMANKLGLLLVMINSDSNVSYTDHNSSPALLFFPEIYIEVINELQLIVLIVIPLILAIAAISTIGLVAAKRHNSMKSKVPMKSKLPMKSKVPRKSNLPLKSRVPVTPKRPIYSNKQVYSNHSGQFRSPSNSNQPNFSKPPSYENWRTKKYGTPNQKSYIPRSPGTQKPIHRDPRFIDPQKRDPRFRDRRYD